MLEQVKVFRATSYENVADIFNAWMLLNSAEVKNVVDIDHFTEYIPSIDDLSDNSRTDYIIRIRYETTLSLLNK